MVLDRNEYTLPSSISGVCGYVQGSVLCIAHVCMYVHICMLVFVSVFL